MKAADYIASCNAGEFSPLMLGRSDLKYYKNACRRLRNMIPTPQGPGRRRGGSRYVFPIRDEANKSWLVRFVFNVEQAYVLEFGDRYIRFYANHGRVMNPSDPANPLEIVTPYTFSDLTRSDGTFALRFLGSNDVMYIYHNDFQTRKLTRTAAAAFNIAAVEFKGGPFKDTDPDNTTTVFISNGEVGAGRTLTASQPIFLAGHVGGLFLLEQASTDTIRQWESGKVVATNDIRRSDGKNYKALNNGTTGSIRPIHSVGSKYDGDAGVQWLFQDPGFGWAKITSIGGGGTTAIADVLSRVPDMAVGAGNASIRWAFGEWSDQYGWPDCATFFRERMCAARDQQVWGTVAGDFEDMRARDESGLITAEMAFRSRIESDRANRIEWLAPSDQALLVGTAGDEHAISEITTSEPFGPENCRAKKQTSYGSRHVQPEAVGDGVVFVQKAGRKVRDMRLAEQAVELRWAGDDLTIFAEHVTRGGIVDMAFQQDPDSVLWCIKVDGQLLGFTINREQDVRGWHPHRIGGFADAAQATFAVVESITTIPAPDGGRDELWMIVRRTINGQTRRFVEYVESVFESGGDPEDAFFVDSGLTLNNTINATLTPGVGATVKNTAGVSFSASAAVFAAGDVGRKIHYRYSTTDVKGAVTWRKAVATITAYVNTQQVTATVNAAWPNLSVIAANGWRLTVTTITGFGHLEGQTIQLCVDGASHPDRTVVGGSVALQVPGSKVHGGLACRAVLQPMPLEAGAADGTAQGKTKRVSRASIRFIDTLGAQYGRDEDLTLDPILSRDGDDNMDESPPLFTGIKTVAWPDGYDAEALITIVQDQPLPLTVGAITPHVTTQDNR